MPVGVLLALPVIWWGSFAILAASVALRRREIEEWLMHRAVRRAPVSGDDQGPGGPTS